MINYLIIDDEPIAHDIIKGYANLLPNMQLQQSCYDAIEALEYLQQQSVDLIFLDLNMPKLKGFEFLRTLTNPPKVIVTTAYQEYALEGYELNIVDYLLKPFGFERFLKAVNKAINIELKTKRMPSFSAEQTVAKHIFLQTNKKYIQVDLTTILYLEAAGNYTKIVTTVETISIREKISEVIAMFSFPDLIQVHKSFVVAKKQINRIEGNRIFIGAHIIPISKTYRLSFLAGLE